MKSIDKTNFDSFGGDPNNNIELEDEQPRFKETLNVEFEPEPRETIQNSDQTQNNILNSHMSIDTLTNTPSPNDNNLDLYENGDDIKSHNQTADFNDDNFDANVDLDGTDMHEQKDYQMSFAPNEINMNNYEIEQSSSKKNNDVTLNGVTELSPVKPAFRSMNATDIYFPISHPCSNQKFYSFHSFVYKSNLYVVGGYVNTSSNSKMFVYNTFTQQWNPHRIYKNGTEYKFHQQPSFCTEGNRLYFMCGKGQNPVLVEYIDLDSASTLDKKDSSSLYNVIELFGEAQYEKYEGDRIHPRYSAGNLVYYKDKIFIYGGKTEEAVDDQLHYYDIFRKKFIANVEYTGESVGARRSHSCCLNHKSEMVIAFGKRDGKFLHSINFIKLSGIPPKNTRIHLLYHRTKSAYENVNDGYLVFNEQKNSLNAVISNLKYKQLIMGEIAVDGVLNVQKIKDPMYYDENGQIVYENSGAKGKIWVLMSSVKRIKKDGNKKGQVEYGNMYYINLE